MSKLEKLIKKLCPNEVEYIKIEDIFIQFSGMTGVSGKWKESGNCKFIDYMNVYKNLKVNVKKLENATVKNLEQNILHKGDILLTSASEIPEECAISSVIENDIDDGVFLDDHLFTLRLKKEYKNKINPIFINYFMHSIKFRKSLNKCTRGVTRFYISIKNFMKIYIPVPPIEVQNEIVQILDNFTELKAELEAELEAREKQYEYYKDKILKFSKKDLNVEWINLGTYCNRLKGTAITASKMKEISENDGNIKIFAGGKTVTKTSEKNIPKEDIITVPNIIVQSRGIIDFIYYDKPCSFKREMWSYTTDNNITLKFIYYYLKNNVKYFRQRGSQMGSMPQISLDVTEKYKIPIPPIEEQERIVSILDKFDKLCNDITQGLPAEIEARRKQYEYYRDKLLNFKETKNG